MLYAAKWIMQAAIANRPHIFGFVSPRLAGDPLLEVWNDDTGTDVALRVDPDGISGDAVDALVATIYPDVHPVASEAAMLALSAKQGDVAIRSDLDGATYMLSATPAATLGNWSVLSSPSAPADYIANEVFS